MCIRLAIGSFTIGLALAGAAQAQGSPNELHDALRLTAAQEPAWRAYRQAVEPTAQDVERERQMRLMLPVLATPRRLALIRAQMQADAAAFERQAAAVNAFYTGLTPEQQRVFDRQTTPSGPGPAETATPRARSARPPSQQPPPSAGF